MPTDTALTRLRADIEARKPWVGMLNMRGTVAFDENSPLATKQALEIATARALALEPMVRLTRFMRGYADGLDAKGIKPTKVLREYLEPARGSLAAAARLLNQRDGDSRTNEGDTK